MSHKLEYVIDKLKAGNVRFDLSRNSADAAVLMLPDNNRVLGVWPNPNKPCPFWINDKFLENPKDPSTHWPNPGGHRIWIAPEKEFFISDLDNPWDTYKVPAPMDPGRYEYKHDNDTYNFSSHQDLYALQSKVKVPLSCTRKIRLLQDQEASEAIGLDCSEHKCIAYQDDVLLQTETDFLAGIWSLIQVPLDGAIYLPLTGPADYQELFGEPAGLVDINDDMLKLELKQVNEDLKIGLIASSTRDRIAHLSRHNDRTILILNIFEKGDDQDYVDTPWKKDDVPGSAAQIFAGRRWGFAELEVHAPVVKDGSHCCSHLKTKVFILDVSNSANIDLVSTMLSIA